MRLIQIIDVVSAWIFVKGTASASRPPSAINMSNSAWDVSFGITAIAAYIGAGGLGTYISRGISQSDPRQLITGAVAVSILAVIADYGLLWAQKRLTPAGLK